MIKIQNLITKVTCPVISTSRKPWTVKGCERIKEGT